MLICNKLNIINIYAAVCLNIVHSHEPKHFDIFFYLYIYMFQLNSAIDKWVYLWGGVNFNILANIGTCNLKDLFMLNWKNLVKG